MRAVMLLAVVAVLGCEGYQPPLSPADQRAETERQADQEAESAAVKWNCSDGQPWGDKCGIITSTLASPLFQKKFAADKCPDLTLPQCADVYHRMIVARWKMRYPLADWSDVALACDAEPRSCEDLKVQERHLLTSHNRHVDRLADIKKAKARADEEAQMRQRWAKATEEFKRLADEWRGRQVCTTEAAASGGLYTLCTR